jgi:hypothetical protein
MKVMKDELNEEMNAGEALERFAGMSARATSSAQRRKIPAHLQVYS